MRQVNFIQCLHCNRQLDIMFGYGGIAVDRCKCSRSKFSNWLVDYLTRFFNVRPPRGT